MTLTTDVFFDTIAFAREWLKILDTEKNLIPLYPKPEQINFIQNQSGRDVIVKARQLGFSTIIQAELFRLAVTETVATMTLAHEDATTQKLRRMAELFYDQMPPDLRPSRHLANAQITTYPDFLSEALIATAGNRHTGRGGTYTHVHGSEVAFWPDAESIIAGVLQAGKPRVVLESTANGASGYFYNLVQECLDGNDLWRLHFYPWWLEPSYRAPHAEPLEYTGEELELMTRHGLDSEQINWRRQKKQELKHLFDQEYPESVEGAFLMSGTSYFGDLSNAFGAPSGAVYDPHHSYYAGLDWGQSVDWTVLSIVDRTADVQVDLLRMHKLPWATMRERIRKKLEYWQVKTLIPEANSMGTSQIEALYKECSDHHVDVHMRKFETTNASKNRVSSQLYDAIHDRGFQLLDEPQQKKEMRAYKSKQLPSGLWKLEGDGEHDDIVIANLLAEEAANGPRGGFF